MKAINTDKKINVIMIIRGLLEVVRKKIIIRDIINIKAISEGLNFYLNHFATTYPEKEWRTIWGLWNIIEIF